MRLALTLCLVALGLSATAKAANAALPSVEAGLKCEDAMRRYLTERNFAAELPVLANQHPYGVRPGEDDHDSLIAIAADLQKIANGDEEYVRVYAITDLRHILYMKLLPAGADHVLINSIWSDILRMAGDAGETQVIRDAAGGAL